MEQNASQEIIIDNRGSFTIEAVFVMLIIISLIFSLIFVSLYCLDQIYVECELRTCIRQGDNKERIKGILGQGYIIENAKNSIWYSKYNVDYAIDSTYPLTSEYLGGEFHSIQASINVCERNASEFIRKYDALINKE